MECTANGPVNSTLYRHLTKFWPSSCLGSLSVRPSVRPSAQPHPCADLSQVAEMCRVGGAELHPTAALMGGMVSQELIKVRALFLSSLCLSLPLFVVLLSDPQ